MATYVKGNAVANATSYELFENVGGTYNKLATATEINFEVSALGLESGDHTLVVKAKADGYEDSDYSNEVVYKVEAAPVEPDVPDDGGDSTPVRFVFAEADTYVAGFVNKRSVHQNSDSHHYCSIPAENVQSVTIVPLMVHEGATSMYYITYKSAAGATQWWVDISAVTPNQPETVDFSDMTDGTIYFNEFYDKNGVIQYPTFVDIVYA